ncbi:MAG TPA: flagellar hook-associated protein FlgK [Bacillota bacterium]|nr:flagellar hook-associated protein FlgK [Bacillota bacterium]
MTSTFFGLELGKRGLYAQQAALYTTGHNISNANTEGYTRQRAEMQATNAIPVPGMSVDKSPAQMGTGVEVNKITRLREDFLDDQYRGENKKLGYWEAMGDTYTKIEEITNEPSENGIANAMDQFYASWQELAKNPESSAARSVVRQRGVALAESFQFVNNSLEDMKTDLDNVISTKVDDINSIATQIKDLNDQISRIVPNNYEPNDLYDKRDLLLDKLSKLVDINVTNSTNGMINVTVGSSQTSLIQDRTANKLSVDSTGKVSIEGETSETTLTSGELLGRIESRYNSIPDFQNKLDSLVSEFANQVDALHSSGINLADINNKASTPANLDFFVPSSGTTINAGNIAVNSSILNSLDNIAAATSSSQGDGQNAQKIADLKFDSSLLFTDPDTPTNIYATSTADDFYQNMIGQLGIDSQQAQGMQENSQVLLNQVDNRRQSVSGVSLDEEMSNMVRFQQAYNASARVVTTMDEILDKVINGMGKVGL